MIFLYLGTVLLLMAIFAFFIGKADLDEFDEPNYWFGAFMFSFVWPLAIPVGIIGGGLFYLARFIYRLGVNAR